MSESLFTSQVPVINDAADGGAAGISTSTGLVFAVDGTVSGIRFYATATVGPTETYTGELWQITSTSTGTRIGVASAPGSAITPGTWNVILFSSPVAVFNGTAYRSSINNDHNQGRYVATVGFFNPSSLVNGNITGFQADTNPVGIGILSNGTFAPSTGPNVYPNTGDGNCYFADVVFNVAGGARVPDLMPFFM